MPQGQLSQSAYENISYSTRQKTAQCTENDGKDKIAQSHNASVLSTKTTVTPPSYYLTKYGEEHCPSSAEQTWLTFLHKSRHPTSVV